MKRHEVITRSGKDRRGLHAMPDPDHVVDLTRGAVRAPSHLNLVAPSTWLFFCALSFVAGFVLAWSL